MATQTDHIRQDAESAARADISKEMSKYKRRMYADAKAYIANELAAADPGTVLDGTKIGEEAVERAIAGYLGTSDVQPAIEAKADRVS